MTDELAALGSLPGVTVDPGAPKEEEVIPTEVEGGSEEVWNMLDHLDACMYCRKTLFAIRVEKLVCDHCHYERLNVAERIDMLNVTALEWGQYAKGDYNLVRAKVHATLADACVLASSRDERMVRQYADGLLAGLLLSRKLTQTPFPVESWVQYCVQKPEVWGD